MMGPISSFSIWQILISSLVLTVSGSSFRGRSISSIRATADRSFQNSLQLPESLFNQWFDDFVQPADKDERRRNLRPSFVSESSRREVEALIAFKESVTNDPLGALQSWKENDTHPCLWKGVRCSSSSNNIVHVDLRGLQIVGLVPEMVGNLRFLQHLDLSDNFLSGSIPDSVTNCSYLSYLNISFNQVSGDIPSQIGELSHLLTLDATKNSLTGMIPEALGNLSSLELLILRWNSLEGAIPSSLSQLSSLMLLDLNHNLLSGTIPGVLGNCSALVYLDLRVNYNLGGELPRELSQLKKMQDFKVSTCNFVGSFPAWVTNFTELYSIEMARNSFAGEIPGEIGKLSKTLTYFVLFTNQLTGPIPTSILNCTALVWLEIGHNQMSGEILPGIGFLNNLEALNLLGNELSGVIPSSLSNCSVLRILDVGSNPMRRQKIPPWIPYLTNLQHIWLSSMNLYGQIPGALGQLYKLRGLALAMNNLGGVLPAFLGNMSVLSSLDLQRNQFQGTIPSEVANLSSITFLQLSQNFFQGSIPSLMRLNELTAFRVQGNLLTGKLDPNVGEGAPQLAIFGVDINNFSGPVPDGIGNFSKLQRLGLSTNGFSGSIPHFFGNLTNLVSVSLQENKFEGGIPVDLTFCTRLSQLYLYSNQLGGSLPLEFGQLLSLEDLALDKNFLTGPIPASFANLTKMRILTLAHNGFSGTIPEGMFFGMAPSLIGVDFSHNFISSSWPPEFNLLANLQHLDVSANSISGSILRGLEACTGLTHLDVSLNNLTGVLPLDLGLLRHLLFFNASFNNFHGPIPTTGFFQTQNTSKIGDSFLGNPALCGSTMLVSHQCSNATEKSSCQGLKCSHIWIPIASASTFIFILLILGGGIIWYCVLSSHGEKISQGKNMMMGTFTLQRRIILSEQELMGIVNGEEDNIIGRGAKSIVYKGILPGDEVIAIKVLCAGSRTNEDDSDESTRADLLREVHILAQLRHVNIVKVLGLCITPSIKALVLEYMPRGSLYDHLYNQEDRCTLSLGERFKIILGIAKSLVYLHHSFHEPILHRDLKPSNILLGMDLQPKLGDFGISKYAQLETLGGELQASASTLCGTVGYIPPECATQFMISTKGDVYSYGIVLLEVLTRTKPTSSLASGAQGFVGYMVDAFEKNPFELLDPTLVQEGKANFLAQDQMMLLFKIGILCTRNTPKMRPSMETVLEMLHQIKDIQVENKPLRTIDELANDTSLWAP